MKTLAAAIAQLLLAAALIHSTACSTTKAAQKAKVDDSAAKERAALVKQLNALIAQGPLHFETDTDILTDESQVLLQRVAAQMHRVPKVSVVVGGHCDERGDTEYNLALGERRAQAAKQYLLKLGIPQERIIGISLGEEQPIVDGHTELAWSQNRRDEFTFLLPGDAPSALKIGTEMAAGLVATTSFSADSVQ